MDFNKYQVEARRTDQLAKTDKGDFQRLLMPLLGLAGEAGQLITEFKNHQLRGDDRSHFAAIVKEELGDVLWYLSNTRTASTSSSTMSPLPTCRRSRTDGQRKTTATIQNRSSSSTSSFR